MIRFAWRPFLDRWSGEWADAQELQDEPGEGDRQARAARWLGFEPADEERLLALEERLGRPLPPSLRSFLQVTDGWRHAGHFVYRLAGTEQIDWCGDPHGMRDIWLESGEEDEDEEAVREAEVWQRSLQLSLESDMVDVLLDPDDVDERGEWAVRTYASWRGSPPDRYESFKHFMEAMYEEFLAMSAGLPGFANETTRSLDAAVEQARKDALGGAYETAAEVLAQAVACGRPRAARMLDQLRMLSGASGGTTPERGGSLHDAYVAREAMPLDCLRQADSGRDDDAWFLEQYPEEDRELVAGVLQRIREGTYRYEASGAFGEAVDAARALARQARPEAAWRALAAAVPSWRPVATDHIAPVGLLADSVLRPVITPERARALLATPRGGAEAVTELRNPAAAAPAGERTVPDSDGLGWLVGPESLRHGFRLLLVEGVDPAELHRRLGSGGPLLPALTIWDADFRYQLQGGEKWESRAIVRTGSAGVGGANWSFAHTTAWRGGRTARFVSPAVAASRGTRALTIVADHASDHLDGRPESFYVSLAEDGRLVHSLAVDGDEVTSTGDTPLYWRPRGAASRTDDGDAEDATTLIPRRTLDAIADAFGVSVSEEAVLRGRLDAFETVSWLREPREGETWAYATWSR
ncbi:MULTISPECIES: SMI1/KNR4 family protein [unclassified Streptomyces]|uniref:SMI1/KNR4 family protein n=1 Tax=unclassified Streptomyces TaxID=2593676 RepID=UPI0033C17DBA